MQLKQQVPVSIDSMAMYLKPLSDISNRKRIENRLYYSNIEVAENR